MAKSLLSSALMAGASPGGGHRLQGVATPRWHVWGGSHTLVSPAGRVLCSLSPKHFQCLRSGKINLHRAQAQFFLQKRPQQPGGGDSPSPSWMCGGLESSLGQGSVGRRVLSLWGMRFRNCGQHCEGRQGETWGCQNRGKAESQGSTEEGREGGSSSCRGELLHFSTLY